MVLGDIARVEVRDYPIFSGRRINGNPALTLQFLKKNPAPMPLALRNHTVAQ